MIRCGEVLLYYRNKRTSPVPMAGLSFLPSIPGSRDEREARRRQRILSSNLYIDVPSTKLPVINSRSYDISLMGLQKLHPFDSSKWGHIRQFLISEGILDPERIVEPVEASKDDLLVVHTDSYLDSLKSSVNVALILEVPPVALIPNFILQRKVLYSFRKQVGGTVLAGKLAKERGWAINIGGGFHHCSGSKGGGFCIYADISLCIQFAFTRLGISKVMIIDLDAHQGNGHEMSFAGDERVYILDMYNSEIYPLDFEARRYINQRVELLCGASTEEYLERLDKELEIASDAFNPELVFYNAGTDILDGDPLGKLKIRATTVENEEVKWWEKDGGPNMHDIHSTQEFLDALSQAGDKLVIAEFYGTWCGSCRALFPRLCKLAAEHPDIVFLKVNFDENKSMCKSLNIKVLPYFHFYRGSEGRLESFSCSLAKFQKLKDAIALHNTARCSIGPPLGVGDLDLSGTTSTNDKSTPAGTR